MKAVHGIAKAVGQQVSSKCKGCGTAAASKCKASMKAVRRTVYVGQQRLWDSKCKASVDDVAL